MSSDSGEMFSAHFGYLLQKGLSLDDLLWVVPRIEAAAPLKRQWQKFKGGGAMATPAIQTVDRLSHPIANRPWLAMQTELVGILRQRTGLVQGLSGEQVWALSGEYLSYAMRLHMAQSAKPALERYLGCGPFSEREAEVILQIAQLWESDFRDLTLKPQAGWSSLKGVVWLNDGEELPRYWLACYLPNLPVHEIVLPVIEGPEPWHQISPQVTSGRIKLALATDLHAQSQQAASQVCEWLSQNSDSDIAIAVLDRLAARRLVPVLESAGVRVDDRTGWRLSTSALSGWFYDLLAAFDKRPESAGLTHPWTRESLGAVQIDPAPKPLGAWAKAWLGALEQCELIELLRNDQAGQILLQTLRDFHSVPSQNEFSASGFLHAWVHQTENERFKPQDINSPVRLLPLLSTRLRGFGRVLVLGCAQSHFQESPPGLLPPDVLCELGMPGAGLGRRQQISALYELIGQASQVVLSHSNSADGKPESLLPELQYLDMCVRKQEGAANKAGFCENWLADFADFRLEAKPQAVVPLSLSASALGVSAPDSLRVTALDDFAACPLRFGLTHVLPFEDTSDRLPATFFQLRGTFVHKVFEAAAVSMQGSASITDFQAWKQPLDEAISKVFLGFPVQDRGRIFPFLQYFSSLVPRIAGVLAERAGHNWRLEQAEASLEGQLSLAGGGVIRLHGRADRIEVRGSETSIVDIKFRDPKELNKAAKSPLEYPQLPVYQKLLGRDASQIEYLGIHKNGVGWVAIEPPEDPATGNWGDAVWAELSIDLDRFFNGAAWGLKPGKACTYCRSFGICRPETDDQNEEEQEA